MASHATGHINMIKQTLRCLPCTQGYPCWQQVHDHRVPMQAFILSVHQATM